MIELKNIIISETDRIGDVILTLPVFKTLKKNNKQIKITALVRDYTADIFKCFKFVDDIIVYDPVIKKNKERYKNLLLKIKSNEYDTAIILHPEYIIAKLFKDAKIKTRISYGWKWYQFLFTKVLIQHRSKNIKHQLEYNLDILKLLKINDSFFDTNIKLYPTQKSLTFIKKLLKKRKVTNKFIIIHPGSGHSALNLPIEKYNELINQIHKNFKNLKIVITGSISDKEAINYLISNSTSPIEIMPENLSLEDLIALISLSKIFISNSTGPLHIASALRIPTISFYSPVFIHSPVRWGPYWGKKLVILPDVKCPQKWKCKYKKCPYYNCFNEISFDNVLAFIKKNI